MIAHQYEGMAPIKTIPLRREISVFEPFFQPEYAPIAIPTRAEMTVAGRRITSVQTNFSAMISKTGGGVLEGITPPVSLHNVGDIQDILIKKRPVKTKTVSERLR